MKIPQRVVWCLPVFLAFSRAAQAQHYYAVEQIDQAKTEARAKHLPIAWVSSQLRYLDADYASEPPGSEPELTQLAVRVLQDQAVIIFQDGDADLPRIPQNMADRIEVKDEGDLPGGWHYTAPKILYVDPALQTIFSCTVAPDLRANRESAIATALLHIKHDPVEQALIDAAAGTVAATKPTGPPGDSAPAAPPAVPLAPRAGISPPVIAGMVAVVLLALGLIVLGVRQR